MKLPLFIQRRLYPFRNYVNEKLFPESQFNYLLNNRKKEHRREMIKKKNEIVSECSYACFIFSLRQFFEEGTRSAEEAVKVFNELGIDKFYIGKKDYSENNHHVNEGRILYDLMINSISDKNLKELIEKSSFYSQIIDKYKDVPI
jgi:hypothetical protein